MWKSIDLLKSTLKGKQSKWEHEALTRRRNIEHTVYFQLFVFVNDVFLGPTGRGAQKGEASIVICLSKLLSVATLKGKLGKWERGAITRRRCIEHTVYFHLFVFVNDVFLGPTVRGAQKG